MYLAGVKISDNKAFYSVAGIQPTAYLLVLQKYTYEIQYIAGWENIGADVLSRYPVADDIIQNRNRSESLLNIAAVRQSTKFSHIAVKGS